MNKTPFERYLEKHQDEFKSIYGSMDNIIVKDRYGDLLNEMEGYKQEQDNYDKYKLLAKKYDLNELEDSEVSGLFTTSILDKTKPELQNDPAYLKYLELNKGIVNDGELDSFLKVNSPDYNNYLSSQELPYDPKVYDEAVFKKAGFTLDEMELFGKYRDKDIEGQNKKLLDFLLGNEMNLNSSGSLGNKLSQQFLKQGSNLALTKEEKQKLKPVISNNKIYYFDEKGNMVKMDDFGDSNKNVMKDHWNNPKNWWVEKGEDGTYYYATNFADESGWTVKKVRGLTDQEIKDYEASLLEDTKKTGSRRTGSRRYSSGPRKKTGSDKESGLHGDFEGNLDDADEEGDVSSGLWADVRNAENKIRGKHDNWAANKDDWNEQKEAVANDLVYYQKLWESNTLTADQMMEELESYIQDLEANGFAPEVIKEVRDTIGSYMKGNR